MPLDTGLSAMMQTAPYAAGFMGAQNNTMNQDSELLDQRRLRELLADMQQKRAFEAQAQPLDLEHKGLNNQLLRDSTIPQGRQELRQRTLANDATEATQPGTIAATNAQSGEKVQEAGEKTTNSVQRQLISVGASMDSIPAPLRRQRLPEILKANGIDPNNPIAQQMIQSLPDDPSTWTAHFLNLANKLGVAAAMQTPAYQAHSYESDNMLKARQYTADISKEVGAGHDAARIKATEIRAGNAADDIFREALKSKTYQEGASKLTMLTLVHPDHPDRAKWFKYIESLQTADLQKPAAKPQPDPTSVGVPVVPSPTPNLGSDPTKTPTPTTADTLKIKAAAEKAWSKYEPEKYNYGFDNGRLWREPK